MTDSDIVVRLRQGWLAHWDTDVRFIMVYASEWMRLTNLTTESADEIERLRQERDEARLEVCKSEAMLRLQRNRVHRESEEVVRMAKEISVERGWDCFKDNPTGNA